MVYNGQRRTLMRKSFACVIRWLFLCALLGVVSISCTTINELERYSYENRRIAVWLRRPPEPEIAVQYTLYLDQNNIVGSIVSVGSNVIKASEVAKAEKKMESALQHIDVPQLMKITAISECAKVLECRGIDNRADADYILDIEIDEYGIDASSSDGHVFFKMYMTVQLYETTENETIWRRNIDYGSSLTPYIGGLVDIVGNVVTAGVLADLSVDDISKAFIELAEEAGVQIARQLEADLLKARFGAS